MKNSKLNSIILILIFFFVGYFVGTNKIKADWAHYKPQLSIINKEPPSGITNVDFTNFWNVWEKLETNYYDKTKLDSQKMLNGAIAGMVQSLGDPFTLYLPPTQNDNFKQGLSGQFSGIGAELGTKDSKIIVIAPINGSPAEKAGVKAGDVIAKVNGEDSSTWTLAQAVDKIRGPKGTDVTLSILHKDSSKEQEIKIVRDTIQVKSVDFYVKKFGDIDSVKVPDLDKEDTVGVIRLSQFGDNTNKEWVGVINNLISEMNKSQNVKGIILDLRNNPGGYLTDATFIASEFLPEGSVVVKEDPVNADEMSLTADRKGLLQTQKLIVLINKGSASASEIVAGSLRDNKRATLVGETSFGKGTVQEAEDLGNGAGLHVTIAKWLTPNGTWVNGKGLTPDVSVALDSKDPSHDAMLEKALLELVK